MSLTPYSFGNRGNLALASTLRYITSTPSYETSLLQFGGIGVSYSADAFTMASTNPLASSLRNMAGSLVSRQTYGSGLATGLSAMETFYGFMRDVGGTIAPPWTTGGGQVTPPQMQQAPEQSHSSPGNIDASDNAHDADEADEADEADAARREVSDDARDRARATLVERGYEDDADEIIEQLENAAENYSGDDEHFNASRYVQNAAVAIPDRSEATEEATSSEDDTEGEGNAAADNSNYPRELAEWSARYIAQVDSHDVEYYVNEQSGVFEHADSGGHEQSLLLRRRRQNRIFRIGDSTTDNRGGLYRADSSSIDFSGIGVEGRSSFYRIVSGEGTTENPYICDSERIRGRGRAGGSVFRINYSANSGDLIPLTPAGVQEVPAEGETEAVTYRHYTAGEGEDMVHYYRNENSWSTGNASTANDLNLTAVQDAHYDEHTGVLRIGNEPIYRLATNVPNPREHTVDFIDNVVQEADAYNQRELSREEAERAQEPEEVEEATDTDEAPALTAEQKTALDNAISTFNEYPGITGGDDDFIFNATHENGDLNIQEGLARMFTDGEGQPAGSGVLAYVQGNQDAFRTLFEAVPEGHGITYNGHPLIGDNAQTRYESLTTYLQSRSDHPATDAADRLNILLMVYNVQNLIVNSRSDGNGIDVRCNRSQAPESSNAVQEISNEARTEAFNAYIRDIPAGAQNLPVYFNGTLVAGDTPRARAEGVISSIQALADEANAASATHDFTGEEVNTLDDAIDSFHQAAGTAGGIEVTHNTSGNLALREENPELFTGDDSDDSIDRSTFFQQHQDAFTTLFEAVPEGHGITYNGHPLSGDDADARFNSLTSLESYELASAAPTSPPTVATTPAPVAGASSPATNIASAVRELNDGFREHHLRLRAEPSSNGNSVNIRYRTRYGAGRAYDRIEEERNTKSWLVERMNTLVTNNIPVTLNGSPIEGSTGRARAIAVYRRLGEISGRRNQRTNQEQTPPAAAPVAATPAPAANVSNIVNEINDICEVGRTQYARAALTNGTVALHIDNASNAGGLLSVRDSTLPFVVTRRNRLIAALNSLGSTPITLNNQNVTGSNGNDRLQSLMAITEELRFD